MEEALRTVNASFDPSQHPRDPKDGEFTGHALAAKGSSTELTRAEQKESIHAALEAATRNEQESFSLGRVPRALADRVESATDGARDITAWSCGSTATSCAMRATRIRTSRMKTFIASRNSCTARTRSRPARLIANCRRWNFNSGALNETTCSSGRR